MALFNTQISKIILLTLILSIYFSSGYSQIHYLKEDFNNQKVIGSGNILHPTSIHFDKNGRGYITLKRGIVQILDTTGVLLTTPLIDISEEVTGEADHGLVGFALDPNFLVNGYFYLLYTVDRHHLLHFGTPSYDPTTTITKQATIGRITRFQADKAQNFTATIPSSRKVLVGKNLADLSFPVLMSSHGLGTLEFSEDGTLLASCGDAGSFQSADLGSSEHTYFQQALDDGIIREKDNIGSFRAQLVDNLAGKIIRIDPATGDGIPSNPFYDADLPRAPKSRVWILGFRNPFRFTIAPETGSHNPMAGQPGTLFIGDVGSGRWEEVSVAEKGGDNFGWPFYEAYAGGWEFWPHTTLNYDAPNPVAATIPCVSPFFSFQELIKEDKENKEFVFINPCDTSQTIPDDIPVFTHHRPLVAWSNMLWNQPTRAHVAAYDTIGKATSRSIMDTEIPVEGGAFDGFSTIPGFYYTEGAFPESFQNSLFVADFSGWIKTLHLDENNQLLRIDNFMDRDTGIVDLALNHKDGCLYYVHYNSHSINKICFGGTPPPIVSLTIDQQYGVSPLSVHFQGAASYDPSNLALDYLWDFGDGMTSEEKNPVHIFETTNGEPALFTVQLTVTNSAGLSATGQTIVSLNNTPPNVKITSIPNGSLYASSDITYLPLQAKVTDAEHTAEELQYTWQSFFHHNVHYHEEPQLTTPAASVIVEPTDCGTSEIFWHRFRLTVTDKHGLSATDEVEIFPFCETAFFELSNLAATGDKKSVLLEWDIIQEDQVIRYDIQRTADYRFETIGNLDAKGNGHYQFEDTQPIIGKNYYRIMVIRSDNAFEYSSQVAINFPVEPDLITVYPTPTQGRITVFTKYPLQEKLSLELFNPMGQLVYQTTWSANIGEPTEKSMNIAYLNNGMYYFRVRNGDRNKGGRIMILH